MLTRPADDPQVCAEVMAAAAEIRIAGGRTGVLLCHGFTGTTTTLRFWAEALGRAGYTVVVPRLPGHGTRWQEMNRVEWIDWVECVADAYAELATRCERVAVAGFSMGGALALRLAELHPEIAAVMLVNPAVYALDRYWPYLPWYARIVAGRYSPGSDVKRICFPGITPAELSYDWTPLPAAVQVWRLWRLVRAELYRVHQPLVLFTSTTDHVVDPSSREIIRAAVSSPDVTEFRLADSHHVATVDNDAAFIFERSVAWLAARMEVVPR